MSQGRVLGWGIVSMNRRQDLVYRTGPSLVMRPDLVDKGTTEPAKRGPKMELSSSPGPWDFSEE